MMLSSIWLFCACSVALIMLLDLGRESRKLRKLHDKLADRLEDIAITQERMTQEIHQHLGASKPVRKARTEEQKRLMSEKKREFWAKKKAQEIQSPTPPSN